MRRIGVINVLIFGAGDGGRKVTEMLNNDNVKILAYIDNNPEKVGQKVYGKEIIPPQKISSFNYDYILIASMYYDEILQQLIHMGIEKNKIIVMYEFMPKAVSKAVFRQMYRNHHLKRKEYSDILKTEELHNAFHNYFVCDMVAFDSELKMKLYDYPDYILQGIDYVRLSTVELVSREIKERNIQGAVAELGVYRGDFSSFISNIFLDRDLYLFDTFEGFNQKDVHLDTKENFSQSKVGHLADTDISVVINKLSHVNNYYIIKGYFPESAVNLDESIKFAFVSIDVDLFKPTYEGLHFFYERLSKGGYIFIHDYNFSLYSGVKEAVRKFCTEQDISYIPVSDYFGSVIITK